MALPESNHQSSNELRLNVFLAAPCPPPNGGITNWQRIVSRKLGKDEAVGLKLIDTSLKKEPSKRGFFYSAKGVLSIIEQARKTLRKADAPFCKDAVLHVCTSGGMGFVRDIGLIKVAHSRKIPAMLHLHFGRVPELLQAGSFESRLLIRALALADGIMTMDGKTLADLCSHGYGEKTCLVPNPIEDEVFCRPTSVKSEEVVFVGHVIQTKGVEELVQAWDAVTKRHENSKLLIIGPVEAEYKDQLARLCDASDIEFCGPLCHEDVLNRIAQAKALVLPSYTEGFPNVVLEAMAVGTPVVATPVGAIPEMLSDGRGVLVPVGNVEDLAAGITRLLEDGQGSSKIVEKAKKHAMDSYSLSTVIDKMKSAWLGLLSEHVSEA